MQSSSVAAFLGQLEQKAQEGTVGLSVSIVYLKNSINCLFSVFLFRNTVKYLTVRNLKIMFKPYYHHSIVKYC